MKKSGFLNRKTPLKRGLSQLRRTPLKKASDKRLAYNLLYYKKKAEACATQECEICATRGEKKYMDAHHPMGRLGVRILHFVWLCKPCHSWVHDNGRESRERGYILPEFDGRQRTKDTPNPWNMPEV